MAILVVFSVMVVAANEEIPISERGKLFRKFFLVMVMVFLIPIFIGLLIGMPIGQFIL
jgi:hypothetical protein